MIKESDLKRIENISTKEGIKTEDVITLALDLIGGGVGGELEVCYDQQDIKRLRESIEHDDSAVYVYVIKNKDNNKCYYGITEKITVRTIQHRIGIENINHANNGINNCIRLGRRKFEMHLLEVFPNREEAERKELKLIQNDEDSYNILGTKKGGRPGGGRPGRQKKDIERALKLYDEREENGHSVNDIAKLTGVPRSTIYHELRKRKEGEN